MAFIPEKKSTFTPEPVKEKKGVLETTGDIIGATKLGQGLATFGFQFTPEAKMLKKLADEGRITPEEYASVASGGLVRGITEEEGSKAKREVAGSAAQTALTTLSLGKTPLTSGTPIYGQGFKTLAKTSIKPSLKAAGLGAGLSATQAISEGKTGKEVAKSAAGGAAFGAGTSLALTGLAGALTKKKLVPEKIASVITQSSKEEAPRVLKTLKTTNLKGVKTYDELKSVLDESLKSSIKEADDIYASIPNKFKPNDIKSKYTVDHITSALDGLEELYKSTQDIGGLKGVYRVRGKYLQEGLNPAEMNKLARDYGDELGKKAFGKTGEQLTSTTATTLENIRSGVKKVARDIVGPEVSTTVDKKISDAIVTKNLVDDMSNKVYELENKIRNENLATRAGTLTRDVLNFMTMGFTRGLLSGASRNAPRGGSILNAIELQGQLSKNIKLLDKALSAEDANKAIKIISDFYKSNEGTIRALPIVLRKDK